MEDKTVETRRVGLGRGRRGETNWIKIKDRRKRVEGRDIKAAEGKWRRGGSEVGGEETAATITYQES